jgi:hypothetical protein
MPAELRSLAYRLGQDGVGFGDRVALHAEAAPRAERGELPGIAGRLKEQMPDGARNRPE